MNSPDQIKNNIINWISNGDSIYEYHDPLNPLAMEQRLQCHSFFEFSLVHLLTKY